MLSRTARTKPQLATGPQKCVVLGPVGELMNADSRDPSDDMVAALLLLLLLAVGFGRDWLGEGSVSIVGGVGSRMMMYFDQIDRLTPQPLGRHTHTTDPTFHGHQDPPTNQARNPPVQSITNACRACSCC